MLLPSKVLDNGGYATQMRPAFGNQTSSRRSVAKKDEEFVKEMVGFGMAYSEVARDDHRLFVDAFRNGQIQGLRARRYATVLTSEL
jgi:hypothetical protein